MPSTSVSNAVEQNKLNLDRCRKNVRLLKTSIRQSSRDIKQINAALRNSTSVGEKLRLINASGLIKGYRRKMKCIMQSGGAKCNVTDLRKQDRVNWSELNSAFKGRVRTAVITNMTHTDPKLFLEDCRDTFVRRIRNLLKKETSIKVNTVFCGEFRIPHKPMEKPDLKYMNTKNVSIFRDTDLKEWYIENVQNSILKELEDFQEKNSGWSLTSVINLAVHINKYTPYSGSSYIKLPQQIRKKHACINVKNTDNACFAWAVMSALHPVVKNTHRVKNYPHYSTELNLKFIQFPMSVKQIPRFEKQNNISINVYILKKTMKHFVTLPTYLTKEKLQKHVNLLMIQNEYNDNSDKYDNVIEELSPLKYHFVWIKHMSRLLSKQQTAGNEKRKYFCDRCLHYYYTQVGLDKHVIDCADKNECKIRLPSNDQKNLTFKNNKYKEKVPFIIYSDLECSLKPIVNNDCKYQEHIPYSIGYYVKCTYDDALSFYRSYRGKDCIEWFTRELNNFAENLETIFLCPVPMDELTDEQKAMFTNAKQCHICEKFLSDTDERVRDHCHITGKYRGVAHNDCNINFKDTHIVPVVFHNLSGYDAHFIIKEIATAIDGRVDLLPINKEKYISFTKNLSNNFLKFRFIDSYRFMASSLESLASYLENHSIMRSEFKNLSDEQFILLKRKGVFPYDFMDSFEKLDYPKLPSHKDFYNSLDGSNISEAHYEHAQTVWRAFNCKNLGNYSDLYLKTDIMLLAEVFEQFRESCHDTYGLDPAHYYTLPGYTWDCMLKYTKIKLELLTNIDMVLFIERGIRGGLSQCSKRYAEANNKYMPSYDDKKDTTYLMYNDINNQYGWAMSQNLPYGEFKWIPESQNDKFNVKEISDESNIGYILEVDLEYPKEIHDIHSDLPFCPEHICPPNSKEFKLMATLNNKYRYVLHYRNLKQALENGLVLKKVHRILEFKQSMWLKAYIDLNTTLRTNAKNDFEKNLFKLMNNAVFGKTMENVRKHSIVKLLTKWGGRYGAQALISKPEFKSSVIFNENLVAIELNKSEIYFNKPIYVGMCVLDISKLSIYDFHYNYTKATFGCGSKLLYTDTDSLIYETKCDDIYDIIKRDCTKYFDTSDYPEYNIYGIPRVNKKVLGMMKDENCGNIMTHFIGLRSKMYAVKVNEGNEIYEKQRIIKKAKGVKRAIVSTKITFEDYTHCLNDSKDFCVVQNLIKSEKHIVNSISQNKIALSPHDDKRFLIKNSYETFPWGHYAIMDMNN